MNQDKALLMDVLKLRFVYDDREFESVIHLLKNKNQDPFLISVLELVKGMDELHQKKTSLPPKTWAEPFSETDPTKYSLLQEVETLLNSRKVFPTVGDLRKYITSFMKITGKKTKAELISISLDRFSKLPLNELEQEIIQLNERLTPPSKENSFMRMANKIVEAKRG